MITHLNSAIFFFFVFNFKNPIIFRGSDYSCEAQSCGGITHMNLDLTSFASSKIFAITVYVFAAALYMNIPIL